MRVIDGQELPTLYEWAGGLVALRRTIDCFDDRVEADDALSSFFPGGVSEHHRAHVADCSADREWGTVLAMENSQPDAVPIEHAPTHDGAEASCRRTAVDRSARSGRVPDGRAMHRSGGAPTLRKSPGSSVCPSVGALLAPLAQRSLIDRSGDACVAPTAR